MSDSERGSGPSVPDPQAPRDRRASPRAAVEIPAVLHVGTREVGCLVRNLSSQGIALSLKDNVPPGMIVRVAFRLPNARQELEVTGVLVRSSGGGADGTVGLQFVDPDAHSVRAIETFVARNRSDEPFSRRRSRGPDSTRVASRESAAALRGLYQEAVDDVIEKEVKRPGLLGRWLGRGKS